MKKSAERRSMTYAMICYSRMGGAKGCHTPFDVYKRIFGHLMHNQELALDVWAVHECLMALCLSGEDETLKAIKEIYLKPFSKDLYMNSRKNEISRRILRFAFENNLDERTVYRRLRKARTLWLKIREYGKLKKEGTQS